LISWINREGILPGRRGTGVYRKAHRQTFAEIATALSRGMGVTAGTKKQVARSDKIIKKGQAGEGVARSGLVGDHVYAVLATKQEDGLCWLQIRNPWGNWGMRYEKGIHGEGPKQGRPYLRPRNEKQAGTFWIELLDFSKHFDTIHTSDKRPT
jgi:hypothetical protein